MLRMLLPGILALASLAPAQCTQPWVAGTPDGNYVVPGAIGDVIYRTVEGQRLALDAWVPPGAGPHPAVILIHGGKWERGSRVAYVTQLMEPLAAAGIAWFSVDYRLGVGRGLNAVQDIAEAARFIRCHAASLRVDPKRVVLLGEDVGAILAILEAGTDPDLYQGVVTLGGSWALENASAFIPPGAHVDPRLLRNRASADPFPKFPPTLVIHGSGDRETPLSEAAEWCAHVRTSGQCQFYTVEGAIHEFENWRPNQWHYKAELIYWLRQRFGMGGEFSGKVPSLPTRKLAEGERAGAREALPAGLTKNIEYAPGLKLDAWIPKGEGPFPAVVIVHGGGWEAGDKTTYVAPLFKPLAAAGFAWFSIDYRLTPEVRHPEQLADVQRAVGFVRQHAASFRVNPKRIALLGESAGGQLVALAGSVPCPAGSNETDCRPNAVVSFYGVYELEALATRPGPRPLHQRLFGEAELNDASRALLRKYSPAQHVRAGLPPFLLIQGSADSLHAQGLQYAEALDKAGVKGELYVLDGAPHGLENWEGRQSWQEYKHKLVEWLHASFK